MTEEQERNAYIANQARELAAAWNVMQPFDQTEIFSNMSCKEATPLIALLSAVGEFEVAEGVMNAHAAGDNEVDDEHHVIYLELQRQVA